MPIDFFEAIDGRHIRQSFESPSVYLDHWAIRLFSDDLQLQDRFINGLKSNDGTLLLSTLSLLEFAGPEDPRHCQDTERFFDRLMPNMFFTDLSIDKTHNREVMEESNEKRFWPSADLPTLKYLGENNCDANGILTMGGLLSMIHQNRAKFKRLEGEEASMLQAAFETHRNDPEYIRNAKNVPPSDQRTRTFTIFGELMRGFNLDPNVSITDNDVVDLLHATAPINCCDYILLDGAWEERVKKMNQRISKTPMSMPIAKCFSKRNNGIELFLSELESFDKSSHTLTSVRP